jgi:hypothetical protein
MADSMYLDWSANAIFLVHVCMATSAQMCWSKHRCALRARTCAESQHMLRTWMHVLPEVSQVSSAAE